MHSADIPREECTFSWTFVFRNTDIAWNLLWTTDNSVAGKLGNKQNLSQIFCSTCLVTGVQSICTWYLYSSGTKQRCIYIRLDTQSLKENYALLGMMEIRAPPTLVLSVLLKQDIAHMQPWKCFSSSVNAEFQFPWSHGMTASSASRPQLTAS